MNIKRIDSLRMDPGTHVYRDLSHDKSLVSVSHVIGELKAGFDEQMFSRIIAKKEKVSQQEILDRWERTRKRSTDYGTCLHTGVENAAQFNDGFNFRENFEKLRMILGMDFGGTWEGYHNLMMNVRNRIIQYPAIFTEFMVCEPKSGVAGTMDLLCQRSVGRGEQNNVTVDLYDFKTNVEKGIEYDSIKREDLQVIKDYNRRMKFPVQYLEDCNYVHYAIQLSLYAYMVESWFGVNIGRLVIWYIGKNFELFPVPVVYLRSEVMDILKYFSAQHSLEENVQEAGYPNVQYENEEEF